MELYGRHWTRREIEARVGRIEQIGGIRRMRLAEGIGQGSEHIQVRTGSGLSYEVTPNKAMDISLAEFGGVPISWQSPNGDVHPSFYHPESNGWLRSASGGLLMTCGLTQVGSPCQDGSESLGLHGRVHHTPASMVSATARWLDDEYVMTVSGVVEETSIFGDCLQMSRRITSRLGSNHMVIEDEVRNIGFKRSPHMMLYHFNFGFPLMNEDTQIDFGGQEPEPREETLQLEGYDRWQAPDPDVRERVYYHRSGAQPYVDISNPAFPSMAGPVPVRLRLSWERDSLPELVQWHMPGALEHVLGIEPANCRVDGRKAERERGTLVHLETGQCVYYKIELEVK